MSFWKPALYGVSLLLLVELYLEGMTLFSFGDQGWYKIATALCMLAIGVLYQILLDRQSKFLTMLLRTVILWIPAVVTVVVNAFSVHRGLAKDMPNTFLSWIWTFIVWVAILAVPMTLLTSLSVLILRLVIRRTQGAASA